MTNRNRAEGWKHAKLSGHNNEDLLSELIRTNVDIQKRILACVHQSDEKVVEVHGGGLHEKNVDCILEGKTKSKTDIQVILSSGKRVKGISKNLYTNQ